MKLYRYLLYTYIYYHNNMRPVSVQDYFLLKGTDVYTLHAAHIFFESIYVGMFPVITNMENMLTPYSLSHVY